MASAHAQRIADIMANEELAKAKQENEWGLQTGYDRARDELNGGTAQALGALGTGFSDARTTYNNASHLYDPYVTVGGQALTAYSNAAGLNGESGNAAARASFQASPGYAWNQEQSADQTARKMASLGIAGSGNTLSAIQSNASHLADQEWNSYTGNLNNLTQLGYGATGAQAGLMKGVGDLYAQEGQGKAGLYTAQGAGLAGLSTGLAGTLANENLQVAQGMGANGKDAGQATDAAKLGNENLLLGIAGLGVNLLTGGGSKGGSNVSKWFS